jgi:hypothetical protein
MLIERLISGVIGVVIALAIVAVLRKLMPERYRRCP